MDYDNVEIIDHADNATKLDVKELLHILKTKPEINRQLGSQSSYEIKTILIQAYPQHRKKPWPTYELSTYYINYTARTVRLINFIKT